MKERNINGAVVLTFDNLERTGMVRHCFTTKVGSEVNIGFDRERTVRAKQVHKTVVRVVTERDMGESGILDGVDGFVTNVKGLVLSTYHADCVSLFILDPLQGVVGLAHAGWRGTLGCIGAETVGAMAKNFGCKPECLLVGVGPSIGRCCFEVHKPVADMFLEGLPQFHELVAQSTVSPEKFNIDLWEINRRILIDEGVPDENIEMSGLCTMCDSRLFHSFRRDGAEAGRMRALVELI